MKKAAEPRPATEPTPRREARRAVTLTGHALLEDGSTVALTVVDLSYDGCKIETEADLVPGTTLKISVLRLGCLDANVRWSADGQVGLSFNPEASFERDETVRNNERIELTGEVWLRRPGRQRYQGRLFDLSPSGSKVEFVERPRSGEHVWIKFEGLDPVEARVCWIDGFVGGIEFLRAFYPAVFELLLARLRV